MQLEVSQKHGTFEIKGKPPEVAMGGHLFGTPGNVIVWEWVGDNPDTITFEFKQFASPPDTNSLGPGSPFHTVVVVDKDNKATPIEGGQLLAPIVGVKKLVGIVAGNPNKKTDKFEFYKYTVKGEGCTDLDPMIIIEK